MDLIGVERRLSMPRMYFYSKLGSDREWIKARMHFIPEDKKHEVSKEYEKRFFKRKDIITRPKERQHMVKRTSEGI